ncbi:hypothetical protein H8E88_34910 [candidate division KSB1 bacterium]|nr:hypothetical protein [candidate division KSB1 bacterium]
MKPHQIPEPINFNSYLFKTKPGSIVVEIAGLTIRIRTESLELIESAKKRYKKFLSLTNNFSLNLDVHLSPGIHSPNPNGTEDFFNEQVFQNDKCLVCSNYFTGYIENNNNYSKVVCSETSPLSWLEHFLRITYAILALQKGDLLFHGAALVMDGKGYIFFGPSGCGKSTVTELSEDCTVLGDDLIVIKRKDNQFRAFATPFNSEEDTGFQITNTNAPITSLYRLKQGKSTFIKEMNPAHILAELLMSVPSVNKNIYASSPAIDLCTQIIDSIPCYEMYFTPDNKFWKLIEKNSKIGNYSPGI